MILLFYIFYRIQKEVSTVTLSPLFSLSFGQRLEMCGPHRRFAPLLSRTLRRIPQAVSAVATWNDKDFGFMSFNVSIPQAVSAVATPLLVIFIPSKETIVSIPQAVSAVATLMGHMHAG